MRDWEDKARIERAKGFSLISRLPRWADTAQSGKNSEDRSQNPIVLFIAEE